MTQANSGMIEIGDQVSATMCLAVKSNSTTNDGLILGTCGCSTKQTQLMAVRAETVETD